MYELEKVVKAEELFRKSMETLKVLDGRNDIAECLEGFAGWPRSSISLSEALVCWLPHRRSAM